MRALFLLLFSFPCWAQYDVSFSYPWSYNIAHPSALSYGDTWGWNLNASGTTYMGCNDCTGINASNDSNIAFLKFTDATLHSASLVNAMTNYGLSVHPGIGQCSGTSPASTQKSSGMVSVGGTFYWWTGCQLQGGVYPQENVVVIKSTDSGANWCRPQDQTCSGSPVSTTSMWAGTTLMGYAAPIQYCADNASCGVSVDGAATYLNILNIAGDGSGMYASRIAYSDLSASWYDATKYAAWQGGSSWTAWNGSNFGTPAAVQCIVSGVTRNCVSGQDFGPEHFYVAWLPNLSTYVMVTDWSNGNAGSILVWTASAFTGPWTLQRQLPQLRAGLTQPVAPSFVGIAAASIAQVSSAPVTYTMTLVYDGPYTQAGIGQYSIYEQTLQISATTTDPRNTISGLIGNTASQFPAAGLWALWLFEPTSLCPNMPDYSLGGAHPLVVSSSTSVAAALIPTTSEYGLSITDQGIYPSPWHVNLPTLPTFGDWTFFVIARARGTQSTNSTLLGSVNETTGGAMAGIWRSTGPVMQASFCVATYTDCGSDLKTVANITDGNWFALVYSRSGSVLSLTTTTTQASPVTTTYKNNAVTWPMAINQFTSNSDSSNFGSYEFAAVGVWTQAFDKLATAKIFNAAQSLAARRGFALTY